MVAACIFLGSTPAAAQGPLQVRLIYDAPPIDLGDDDAAAALDTFFTNWRQRQIDLSELEPSARRDAGVARLLLGQSAILGVIAAYRQDHPGPAIRVLFDEWPGYFSRLSADASSPTPPHVVEIPSSWCASLATQPRLLVPLPETMERDALERFPPRLVDACRVEGRLYGMPWRVDVRFLFYDRTLLSTLPRRLAESPGRDGFRQAIREARASRPDVPAFALPSGRDWDLLHQTAMLMGPSADSLIVNRWWSRSSRLGDLAPPALEWVRYLVLDSLAVLPRVTRAELEDEFVAGRLGSVVSGPWMFDRLFRRLGDDWLQRVGVVLPPIASRPGSTYMGGLLFGLTSAGANGPLQTDANALVEFLTGDASEMRADLAAPASLRAIGSIDDATTPVDAPPTYLRHLVAIGDTTLARTFLDALAAGHTYSVIPEWASRLEVPSTLSGLYHVWQAIAAGEPEAVVHDFVAAVDREWDQALRSSLIGTWLPALKVTVFFALVLLSAVTIYALRTRRALNTRRAEASERVAVVRHVIYQMRNLRSVDDSQMLGQIDVKLDGLKRDLEAAHSAVSRVDHRIRKLSKPLTAFQDVMGSIGKDRKPPHSLEAPDRIRISLPGKGNGSFRIAVGGVETEPSDPQRQILEYLFRRLCVEGTDTFSVLTRYVVGDDSVEVTDRAKDRVHAWTQVVSKLRRMLGVGVLPRGMHRLNVDPNDVKCSITSGQEEIAFQEVVEQIRQAGRLRADGEYEQAFATAIQAYRLEQELDRRDEQLLIELCASWHGLPGESRDRLGEADRKISMAALQELDEMAGRYETAVVMGCQLVSDDTVAGLGGPYRSASRPRRDDAGLVGALQEFRERLEEINEARRDSGAFWSVFSDKVHRARKEASELRGYEMELTGQILSDWLREAEEAGQTSPYATTQVESARQRARYDIGQAPDMSVQAQGRPRAVVDLFWFLDEKYLAAYRMREMASRSITSPKDGRRMEQAIRRAQAEAVVDVVNQYPLDQGMKPGHDLEQYIRRVTEDHLRARSTR